jgi:hypothetical protein
MIILFLFSLFELVKRMKVIDLEFLHIYNLLVKEALILN